MKNTSVILAAVICACFASDCLAQQAVATKPADAEADEGLVTAVNRTLESPFDVDRAVEVITIQEIWRRNARTLPEVLMEETGVFVQQTNYGAGSPFIRGLVGKQILIMVDGVRVNNATYRFGPLQYLATIDLASVERIEIVRGAVSVLDDALGGIINVVMRKAPSTPDNGTSARLSTRYSSADRSLGQRVEIAGSGSRHRYLAGVTFRDTGDVRIGGGERLPATGYKESGGNLSLESQLSDHRTFSAGYIALQQSDVPRTDRILDGTDVRFDFEPQRLQLAHLTYDDQNLFGREWTQSLRANLYWNRQDEGNLEIRRNRTDIERRFYDSVNMIGANLELTSFLAGRQRLVYGVDFASEDIHSRRVDVNLISGARTPRRGKYTDGSSFRSAAVYLQDRVALGKRVAASIGGRYSRFHSTGSEVSPVGPLDLNGTTSHVSGAASISVRATPSLRLVGTYVSGFRPPNIDDLSVYEERSDGTEIPNTAVRPEILKSAEIGLRYAAGRVSASAFVFQNDLENLLVRTSGTYEGLPFFDLNGNGRKDSNEPAVLQKQNIGKATIRGVELQWRVRPADMWVLYGNYSITHGDDDFLGVPLSRVPPKNGMAAIRWTPAADRAPWAELLYLHADAQHRLAPADLTDTRIGPQGTPGFGAFTLRGGMTLHPSARLVLAWENFTDQRYKYHASGTYRPGSQLVLGFEWQPALGVHAGASR